LKQSSGSANGSRRNTVDVEIKEGDASTRRSTIDLHFKDGRRRSRANTLELKLNGEVMKDNVDDRQSPSRVSRTYTVRAQDSANGSPANSPTIENQRNLNIDNSQAWSAFNPKRQFYLLKAIFILLCFVDIMHWAYLLRHHFRDDSVENPNSWRFYKKFHSFDVYYLVARMFGDIFTCVLGLGAAMWTRKHVLTLPCTMIQLLFLLIRAVVWSVRAFNKTLTRVESTSEDRTFVALEFVLPAVWALLSVLIVHTMKQLRSYEQLHGYAHPPVIVLTVKNDDNDESVQIEIA
uniref:EXS domain-containing protein n=1 Tax=Heligmosomoides polygyrus TaxID=6339 RepID=A0A8L8KDF0_HELPZ